MIKIGIVGDIGSGKSFVARQFGYPVFDADKEVLKIYKKNKNCFKKVPPLGKLEAIDKEFLQKVKEIAKECEDAYATFSVRKASQQIMELASISNTYFDAKKPWKGWT